MQYATLDAFQDALEAAFQDAYLDAFLDASGHMYIIIIIIK